MNPISDLLTPDKELTFSLIYASQTLGLLRAEVARILRCQCTDVGALFEGRAFLQQGCDAWEQAALFVRFFQVLEQKMQGNEVQMVHWLRSPKTALGDSPFYLMVDEDRLQDVMTYLKDGDLAGRVSG